MALRIKVPCSGEEHELLIRSYDGDGEHLEVELVNHDYEYDIAVAAMWGRMPACYNFEPLFSKGMSYVFLDETMIPAFIKALQEQGVEALGISQDEFVDQVVDFLDWRMSTYNSDLISVDSFLEMVADKLSWMKGNEAFQSGLHRLANIAYRHSEWEVFVSLVKFAKKPLIRIEGTRNETKDEGDWSEGHTINRVTIRAMIDDSEIDKWTFGYVGWFMDIENLRWNVEREDGSGSANGTTDDFLTAAGMDLDAIESKYKPDPPELPKRYKTGKWAIIHEHRWGGDDFCGYFRSEEDARAMYQIAVDIVGTTQAGGDLKLLHRTAKSKAKDFDTWEVLEED